MDNYLLDHVVEFSPALLTGKPLLIVHKLHRTPYHIGIVYGDQYYALTVKGIDTKGKAELLESLADKTHNNLILELNIAKADAPDAAPFFTAASLDHVQFTSCLFPVKNLIAALTTNNKFSEANNLFELLDLLKENNLVGQIMATRMTPLMEAKVVLLRYDTDAIVKHIKRLQEIEQREKDQKHIS